MIEIKIKDNEVEQEEKQYPYIGYYDDCVINEIVYVLFIYPYSGFNLNEYDSYDIGHYSNTWQEEKFKKFTGIIELSNKESE